MPVQKGYELEFKKEAADVLVRSLRNLDVDPLDEARKIARNEQLRQIADFAGWSISGRGEAWLLETWLQPLYLDRVLWRAYGTRDYAQMNWPRREDLGRALGDALIARAGDEEVSPRELREREVLPRLLARCWPDALEALRGELEQERTFSAKWPLAEEKLREMIAAADAVREEPGIFV
jgi:hypothetical protein